MKYKLYLSRKPNVTYFRVFGCHVYVGTPKQLRTKLDLCAKHGIMIGYARSTRGYRICLLDEQKLIETCNVRFDESSRRFWCILSLLDRKLSPNILLKEKSNFYVITPKNQRPLKTVLKGLPVSYSTDEIATGLLDWSQDRSTSSLKANTQVSFMDKDPGPGLMMNTDIESPENTPLHEQNYPNGVTTTHQPATEHDILT
ncbi:copia protein [Caerostris extrusa]|uniref:Copia protein n=1 Tax=Caerostris extrusa TaxID=172846 RepID=A0AAV4VJV9_CAEEX|nr:copia protein [Caerostris extrusa]